MMQRARFCLDTATTCRVLSAKKPTLLFQLFLTNDRTTRSRSWPCVVYSRMNSEIHYRKYTKVSISIQKSQTLPMVTWNSSTVKTDCCANSFSLSLLFSSSLILSTWDWQWPRCKECNSTKTGMQKLSNRKDKARIKEGTIPCCWTMWTLYSMNNVV